MSDFYIEDQAVLYALLVKAAGEERGEAGLAAAEAATRLYGRERGLRMAMRCLADGGSLSPNDFLDYGEWADDRGWSETRAAAFWPFELEVRACGWEKSWRRHGLLAHGRLYCRHIDYELARGFNPENELLVKGTLTWGSETCRFIFVGAGYDGPEGLAAAAARRGALRRKTVKDFLFHSGHVLSAFRRVLWPEFGLIAGSRITEAALAAYAALFGAAKAKALIEEAGRDYLEP